MCHVLCRELLIYQMVTHAIGDHLKEDYFYYSPVISRMACWKMM